jgi:NosR/NirI family nitrous oxide reductase transcriptional regulator
MALSSPSAGFGKEGGGGGAKPLITHKGKAIGTGTAEPPTAEVPTTAS